MRIFVTAVICLATVFLVLVNRSVVHDGLIAGKTIVDMAGRKEKNVLPLHFHDRRPYFARFKQEVYGLIATPVAAMLDQADIPFTWVETPAKRQMDMIRSNNEAICAIGWFKTAQRQRYAKFTEKIYEDGPLIVLTRADNRLMKDVDTLDRILAERRLRLLRKSGYSYGAHVEEAIDRYDPWILKTTANNIGMAEMIAESRADYCFMTEVEASELLIHSSLDRKDFRIVPLEDIAGSNARYIICSRKVADETIERMNDAIAHVLDTSTDRRDK